MQIEKKTKFTRLRSTPRLLVAGLLAVIVAIASSGLVAFGAFHNNGADGLAAVGPVSGEYGFPTWYKDTNGIRLEPCLDIDTHCLLLTGDVPFADQPISFPDNFPGEIFWFAADSLFTTPSGLDATLILALEGAFASGEVPIDGDQVAFGRVRIRIGGLVPGAQYTVTHPYGTDIFVAEPDPKNAALGEINFTEDIGIGAWSGPLSSRIGPFLTAVNPPPPAGYIGSAAVEQTVTGSPYNTNYFMIQGPGVRAAGETHACPADTANTDTTCAYNDLFAVAGKLATNAGVDINTVLYSRDAAGASTLNVYASSEAGQSIQVDGANFFVTNAVADGPNYYARIDLGLSDPAQVTVTNQSDNPPTSKNFAKPIDIVTIGNATYDTDTKVLTVEAASSDEFSMPTLTLEGFGDLVGGSITRTLEAAPLYATVRSTIGGWDTEQVRVVGAAHAPMAVLANPGAIQTVTTGGAVALNGTSSQGEIQSYLWEQVDNGAPAVTLSNANTAIATFVAPANPGTTALVLRFSLTVDGPGGPNTAFVNVRVRPSGVPPVARAGADQTVLRGTSVTVDGAASTNGLTYSWTQASGPAVVINNPTSPRASFTYPQSNTAVVLTLTVTGPGGSNSDNIRISPLADSLAITSAQFTRGTSEWRVRGTALAAAGNVAYIYNSTSCPVGGPNYETVAGRAPLATVPVDALGAWELRGTGPTINGTRVSVCTLGGARVANFVVRIR